MSDALYTLYFKEAVGDCSLRLTGGYEEVLATGIMHAQKFHGYPGSELEARARLEGYLHEIGGRREDPSPWVSDTNEKDLESPPPAPPGPGDANAGVNLPT